MVFPRSRRDRLVAALVSPDLRRPVGLLAVLVAGALLAGCSSSQSAAARRTKAPTAKARQRHRAGTTTTIPVTTSPARATTTTTTGATTTAPAADAPGTCSSGVLALHEAGVAAAAGTSHLTFALTNQGPRTCTLDGYPSVRLFGGSGAGGAGAGSKLAVRDIELGASPRRVTLSSGTDASFVLSVSEVPVNGVGCTRVASLQVVPPGDQAALGVPAAFQACGDAVGVYAITGGS